MDAGSEPTWSREHVFEVLARLGFRGPDADRLVEGLTFPVTFAELQGHMAKFGITENWLISEMGGSP